LLGGEEVADVAGEVLFEGFFVGFLGDVFALLGCGEEGVVAAAEFGFELAPGAVDLSGDHAALVDVFDTEAVELVFEFAGEVGAHLRFLEEEGAGLRIFEVLFKVHEALVAVAQDVDELAECCFYFFEVDTFGHGCSSTRLDAGRRGVGRDGARVSRYNLEEEYSDAMAHMVFCAKYKQEMVGLDEPPFDSDFGQKIYKSVSKKAWGEWVERQKMLLNEYRLQPWTREAQEFLVEQMNEFFFGEGGALPKEFVAPTH
jgi:Fe-S cluster biosynthesis and repair protein YggX